MKLADIVKLFTSRLQQLGDKRTVNTSRLKETLLAEIPDLQALTSKKGILLSFNISDTLLLDKSSDSNDVTIMQAAKIIRQDIFTMDSESNKSENPLKSNQSHQEPLTLLTLIQMILGATCFTSEKDYTVSISEVVSSISQLLIFNCL